MRAIRRHDLSPRVENMPMIDVIFLLLTFFIYSMITMVRAEVLPVKLQALTTGESAKPATVVAVTIDSRGGLYLNRSPIDDELLEERLGEIARNEAKPKLFLALEDVRGLDVVGEVVDRGPLLIELIERVRRAGIEDFSIVGDRASP